MIRYGLRGHEDRSVCTDKEALLRSQDANDRIAMAFMDKDAEGRRGGQARRTNGFFKSCINPIVHSTHRPSLVVLQTVAITFIFLLSQITLNKICTNIQITGARDSWRREGGVKKREKNTKKTRT